MRKEKTWQNTGFFFPKIKKKNMSDLDSFVFCISNSEINLFSQLVSVAELKSFHGCLQGEMFLWKLFSFGKSSFTTIKLFLLECSQESLIFFVARAMFSLSSLSNYLFSSYSFLQILWIFWCLVSAKSVCSVTFSVETGCCLRLYHELSASRDWLSSQVNSSTFC